MSVRSRWVGVAAVLVSAALGFSESSAQTFGIRLERGEIGVDGRGRLQNQDESPGNASNNYQQWLRLPVSGFLLHPRVLRYSLAVRPLFGQYTASSADRGTHSRSMGLDGSATFFQGRRLSLTLQATKSSGTSSGDFSTESRFDNSDMTGTLFVRSRYFPTTVTYTDRAVADRWQSAFVSMPIERDQRSTRLRGEVRNKKLTTTLERTSYRDLRGTSDHEAVSAQARHRVTWGKGSSIVSIFNHYDRVGSSAISRTSWSERVTIVHTKDVSTGLALSRQSWSREGLRGRNLNYEGTSRFNPSLDVSASISVAGQRFHTETGGGLSRFRVAPSGRYVLRFGEASLSTNATVGTEHLRRTLPSDALIDVLEERHQVEASLLFALDQLRVDVASIEIWNEARTLLLRPEIDYVVIEVGPVVEIQILPGGRVSEGEIVLVTYRYRSLAREDVGLFYVNYDTSLRFRGLSLRHGRRQRSRDVSGPGGALDDPNDVDLWFGFSAVRPTRIGALRVDLTRRTREASEIDYVSDELRAALTLPPLGTVGTRLRMSANRTVADDLRTRTSSVGANASWIASRTVRVSGGVDVWIWERDQQRAETFLSGNLMTTWQFGEVNAIVTLDQVRRSNGRSISESRWSVRVVRRF